MGQGGGAGAASRLRQRGIGMRRSRMGVPANLASRARRALAGTNWTVNARGDFVTRRPRG